MPRMYRVGNALGPLMVLCSLLALGVGCPREDSLVGEGEQSRKQTRRQPDSPLRIAPDAPWRGRAAAFTFSSDDNNDANLVWAEVARRSGVRFTVFTVSNWVGNKGKLTWEDLRSLHDDGFEIGGHSVSHPRLTQLDDRELERELAGCQTALERGIARPDYACMVFAYPFHDHNGRVIAETRRFYTAARDGGLSSQGWPGFSRSSPIWGDIDLYDVPNSITAAALVMGNAMSEEETRSGVRGHLEAWKNRHFWVNLYAHGLNDIDGEHLGWILDELIEDGGVWIAPFGEVARYYRETTGN